MPPQLSAVMPPQLSAATTERRVGMYSIIKCTLNTTQMSMFYGTFKSCPKFFEQLYTARVQRWNLQSVCLCADKKKPTYIRILQLLQSSCNERNFTLSTATVHTDLEVTMISAVHNIWPEAVVALSNFHLCQAWYREIQAFNLTRDYRDVKSLVGRWLRLVFALPTVSADSVRECFLTTLTDLMPDTTEANLFADYIYGTYLHQDCSFPPIMWADILCRNVKTTNA